jgi:hypothetical protein
MLRLAADENFNNDIIRGLLRRKPDIDIARAQDVGLSGCEHAAILRWCAEQSRVLVTHDVSTMSRHAYERTAAELPMPGVFEVASDASLGRIIDDLLLICECSVEGEWEGQIRYLPL